MQVAAIGSNPISTAATQSAASAATAVAAAPARTISTPRPSLAATYSYHESLRQVIVTMYRPDTGQVIRQIPPDAIIAMAEAILSEVHATLDERA
jgi:ABC-type transporter Mla subunit MlaD